MLYLYIVYTAILSILVPGMIPNGRPKNYGKPLKKHATAEFRKWRQARFPGAVDKVLPVLKTSSIFYPWLAQVNLSAVLVQLVDLARLPKRPVTWLPR